MSRTGTKPTPGKVTGSEQTAAQQTYVDEKTISPGTTGTQTVSISADDEVYVKSNTMSGNRSYVKDPSVVNDEGIGNSYTERFTYSSGDITFSPDFAMKRDAFIVGHEYILFCIWFGDIFDGGIIDKTTNFTLIQITSQSIYAGNTSIAVTFVNPNGGNEDSNLLQYKLSSSSTWIDGASPGASGATEVFQSGLIAGSEYDFQIIPKGSGDYSDATPSPTLTTTTDANLLLTLDASYSSKVTTAGSSVTEWQDITGLDNDFTTILNTPAHSIINGTVTFSGVHSLTRTQLIRDSSPFEFQQSDDFTIFIKGLVFDSSYATVAAQHVINTKDNASALNGYSLNLSSDANILYMSQKDATIQNFAQWAPVGGFKDDASRDMFLQNESGVLKIYDATNTNVGVNGTTSIGAITYPGTIKLGTANSLGSTNPFNGSVEGIKIWDKALSSAERATELGI